MGSKEYEFAEPMVFDLIGRLGAIPGEKEIKYLMIIPLNGDPIEFVPEVETVYAHGAAVEIEIPIIRTTWEKIRLTNQLTYKDEPDHKQAVQLLADVYMEEPYASIVGVHISAQRLTRDIQQIIMYGNKMKVSYEEFLSSRHQFHKTKLEEEVDVTDFETARKTRQARQTAEKSKPRGLKKEKLKHDVDVKEEDDRQARHVRQARKATEEHGEEKEDKHEVEILSAEVKAAGFILNYSIFYSMNPGLIFGVEILAFYDVADHLSYLAFYPQLHAQISEELEIQVGPGLVFTKKKIIPEFVHRVIIETLPNHSP